MTKRENDERVKGNPLTHPIFPKIIISPPCLPDDDPVLRSQIHGVAFFYVVGLVEFFELLYDRIDPILLF